MPALRSGPAWRFIVETATPLLQNHNQDIISHWLIQETNKAAAPKVLRLRLHYERKTWPQKSKIIRNLCQKTASDIDAVHNGLTSFMAEPLLSRDLAEILEPELVQPIVCTFLTDQTEALLVISHEKRSLILRLTGTYLQSRLSYKTTWQGCNDL